MKNLKEFKINPNIIEYYLIENSFIGFLNGGEKYTGYMQAMEALINKAIDEEICSSFPKSKWSITGITYGGEEKVVYTVTSKKLMS